MRRCNDVLLALMPNLEESGSAMSSMILADKTCSVLRDNDSRVG